MQAIITIPQPCTENWEAMRPEARGRHCRACAHTVVDFTGWALPDIAGYLRKHAGQKVCGRFLNTQIGRPFDLIKLAPRVVRWRAGAGYKTAVLIIICFAIATTGCEDGGSGTATGEPQTVIPAGVMADTTGPQPFSGDTAAQAVRTPRKIKRPKSIAKEEGISPHEYTTMGAPALDYPREIIAVPAEPSKFRPAIGPPEDDSTREYQSK